MSLSAQPTCLLLSITIEDIEPKKLGSTSYAKYVKQLTITFRTALKEDGTCLIDILEAIKNCSKPCFKRDVLLEILNLIVNSSDSIIDQILHVDLGQSPRNVGWKNFANHIVTLPDVVANSDGLRKYPKFKAESFFSLLLGKLYDTLQNLLHSGYQLCDTQKCLYVQILGRVALSGCNQLVWDKFTSRLFKEQEEGLKPVISNLFTYPLQNHCQSAPQFELFIEPLYMPVFFNVKPTKDSGKIISSILGHYIHSNESFQYVVCDKCILQNNYKHDKSRQARTLFNIFSYLSSMLMMPGDLTLYGGTSTMPELHKVEAPDLLTKTLLEVAQSWSNGTKISFRNYEHSRYLTSAFIVAFRYAMDSNKQKILDKSEELQACIMRGIPIYLNKSTSDYRNLALCIGETVLQALHELIDENSMKDLQQQQQKKSKEALKLDFGIELDEESQSIKRLFQIDLDEMFGDYHEADNRKSLESSKPTGASKDCAAKEARSQTHSSTIERSGELRKSCSSSKQSARNSAKRAVVELDSDEEEDAATTDDNLVPYELSDDSECGVDKDEVIGDDSVGIPIYLQDCIDGLAENSNPRYVRLCLMKADELVKQLSQQEALEDRSRLDSSSTGNENILSCLKASDSFVNDAIRDCAIELAQLLLYLDDQYNLQEFDALRMNALSSLCVAAPDLVVKHLIDEFNGAHRSTRHQLDILQALVRSARQLSGCLVDVDLDVDGREAAVAVAVAAAAVATSTSKKSVNKLVKYVSLYFYGIIHQLKAEPSYCISPATIVSTYDGDNRLDDSYLLGRIFFSISLIIECVHQQPITCKLSNDLIDLLANYRYHSDSGVRKAIVRCLKVVRDCTPNVYFKEYLEEKTSNLFNQWLANELASLELFPPPTTPTTCPIRFN